MGNFMAKIFKKASFTRNLVRLLSRFRIVQKELLQELAEHGDQKQAVNAGVAPGPAVDQHQPREQREHEKERHDKSDGSGERVDERALGEARVEQVGGEDGEQRAARTLLELTQIGRVAVEPL